MPAPFAISQRCRLAIILAAVATATANAQPAATVRALLDDAAARFNIPPAILYGVAFTESRWHNLPADSLPGACTGMPPAIGIMGLHDDAYFGHSLGAGSAIGISERQARQDMQANILCGAYHLSALFNGTNRDALEQWIPAIGRYSGIPDSQPGLQLLYTEGVFALLKRGWYAGDQFIAPVSTPTINRASLVDGLGALGITPAGAADYPNAQWNPSPNYSSRSGTAVSAITIHDTEGNFAGSLSWLVSTESQASAHYMIRSVDGFTVQMVRESDKAWHVRTENPYTIGIEHEGYVARPEYFTPDLYRASADLVRFLADRYNVPIARTHIKGHLDFPNNTHTDPGGWWDWPAFYRLVARQPAMRVVMDPFEDNVVGWWQPQMSGSTVNIDSAVTAFAIASSAGTGNSNAGRITYGFNTASGGVVRVFRSGHGNTTDGLLNVGTSGVVTLAVRGDSSGNMLELWFYDAAKKNVPVALGPISWSGWRTVYAPVGGLAGSGPFRLHSVVIAQARGGARSGAIDVDELAHVTGMLSVPGEHGGPAGPLPMRLALAAQATTPASWRPGAPCQLYTAAGERIAGVRNVGAGPVGSWIGTGVYVLQLEHATYLLMIH